MSSIAHIAHQRISFSMQLPQIDSKQLFKWVSSIALELEAQKLLPSSLPSTKSNISVPIRNHIKGKLLCYQSYTINVNLSINPDSSQFKTFIKKHNNTHKTMNPFINRIKLYKLIANTDLLLIFLLSYHGVVFPLLGPPFPARGITILSPKMKIHAFNFQILTTFLNFWQLIPKDRVRYYFLDNPELRHIEFSHLVHIRLQ